MSVPVQKLAGYPQKHPIFDGRGPRIGPVPAQWGGETRSSAVDVPQNGPSTAKKAQNAADGPKNGTSTTPMFGESRESCETEG